jgi:hypothetical protein
MSRVSLKTSSPSACDQANTRNCARAGSAPLLWIVMVWTGWSGLSTIRTG